MISKAPKQLKLLSFGKLRCPRRMTSLHPHDLHAQRAVEALLAGVDLAEGAVAQQFPCGEQSLEAACGEPLHVKALSPGPSSSSASFPRLMLGRHKSHWAPALATAWHERGQASPRGQGLNAAKPCRSRSKPSPALEDSWPPQANQDSTTARLTATHAPARSIWTRHTSFTLALAFVLPVFSVSQLAPKKVLHELPVVPHSPLILP